MDRKNKCSIQFQSGVRLWRLVALVLVAIPVGRMDARGAEIPRAAYEAWSRYRRSLEQAGFVVAQTGTTNGKLSGTTVYRWTRTSASVETDNPALVKSRNGYVAYARNSDYAFHVAKGGNNASWSLQDLLFGKTDTSNPMSTIALLTRDMAMPGLWGLRVESVLLPDAIDEGLITIESIRKTTRSSLPVFEVAIRADPDRRGFSVHRGSLLLSPTHSWMITEARLDLVTKRGRRGELLSERTYNIDTSEVFGAESALTEIPVVITHERTNIRWDDGKGSIVQELAFDWKSQAPLASQFRLTHYGLPEPAVLSDGWIQRVLPIVICALAIIMIGLLLRRKTNRAS